MGAEKGNEVQQQNIQNIYNREDMDVSSEGLARRIHTKLSPEFSKTLSSSEFYARDKAMPASYPVLLLKNLATGNLMKALSKYIISEHDTTTQVLRRTHLYVIQTRDGVQQAMYVGVIDLTLEIIDLLDFYIIEYSYLVSKGVTAEIDRASLVNFEEFNPIIDPGDNIMNYSDIVKDVTSPKVKLSGQTIFDEAMMFHDSSKDDQIGYQELTSELSLPVGVTGQVGQAEQVERQESSEASETVEEVTEDKKGGQAPEAVSWG